VSDKIRKMWMADWVPVKEAVERDVEVITVSFLLGTSSLMVLPWMYCRLRSIRHLRSKF
jgi:hypothetical protein